MEQVADGTYVMRSLESIVTSVHPLRHERVLAVTPRGDTLGVLTEVALMRDGQAPGAIEVRSIGVDAPVTPPAGGRVHMLSPMFPMAGYFTIGAAPDGAAVAGEAPPRKYELDFEGPATVFVSGSGGDASFSCSSAIEPVLRLFQAHRHGRSDVRKHHVPMRACLDVRA